MRCEKYVLLPHPVCYIITPCNSIHSLLPTTAAQPAGPAALPASPAMGAAAPAPGPADRPAGPARPLSAPAPPLRDGSAPTENTPAPPAQGPPGTCPRRRALRGQTGESLAAAQSRPLRPLPSGPTPGLPSRRPAPTRRGSAPSHAGTAAPTAGRALPPSPAAPFRAAGGPAPEARHGGRAAPGAQVEAVREGRGGEMALPALRGGERAAPPRPLLTARRRRLRVPAPGASRPSPPAGPRLRFTGTQRPRAVVSVFPQPLEKPSDAVASSLGFGGFSALQPDGCL